MHVWFGPSPGHALRPNGNVRAGLHAARSRAGLPASTVPCAPAALSGDRYAFMFGARAAPRLNGTVRAGPHAARSRARLPDRTARASRCSVPCAPARCSVYVHAARAITVLLGAGTVGRLRAAAWRSSGCARSVPNKPFFVSHRTARSTRNRITADDQTFELLTNNTKAKHPEIKRRLCRFETPS